MHHFSSVASSLWYLARYPPRSYPSMSYSDERSYEERVSEKAFLWGMDSQDLARVWFDRCCGYGSPYGTAILFPMSMNGRDCIIAACSTAETNRMQATQSSAVGVVLHDLAWMSYECFKFEGLAFLNFQGMTDPAYASSVPIGTLRELLDAHRVALGIPDWRQRFGILRGGPYLGGLRDLLRCVETPVWLELASGSSRSTYAALDVFVRTFAGRYAPNVEARYLLYDRDVAPEDRRVLYPWDWWQFSVWESCGQGEPNFEYTREFIQVLGQHIVSHTGPLPGSAEYRMWVLSRQLRPSESILSPQEGTVALKGKGKGGKRGRM